MTIERDPATNWPRNVLTDQTNGSYATFVGDCLLTDITPDGILLIVGSSGLLEALQHQRHRGGRDDPESKDAAYSGRRPLRAACGCSRDRRRRESCDPQHV